METKEQTTNNQCKIDPGHINPETGKITSFDSSNYEREVLTKIFEQKGITEYEFSDSDSWARYDVIFTTASGKKYIAEIKNREITSDKFKTTVLESKKVHWLCKEAKRLGVIPMYIATFTDHKYILFNLFNVASKLTPQMMPSKSCSCVEGSQTVMKSMYHIPMDAEQIKELGFERRSIPPIKMKYNANNR